MRILFDYFSAWAEEKNVRLELEGEPVWMTGDRLMKRGGLSNLLSNAIRYTPVGSRVIATISIDRKSACINVFDAVEPITKEQLHKINDRFDRPDATEQPSS